MEPRKGTNATKMKIISHKTRYLEMKQDRKDKRRRFELSIHKRSQETQKQTENQSVVLKVNVVDDKQRRIANYKKSDFEIVFSRVEGLKIIRLSSSDIFSPCRRNMHRRERQYPSELQSFSGKAPHYPSRLDPSGFSRAEDRI